MRGVFEDGQLVGGMGFYRMAHWFGGGELAAAGSSGVAINPAHRGGGNHLATEDDLLTENSGRWTLAIDGGLATVQPGGEGVLKMYIRALAPLYSSFFSASQLVRLGMIKSEAKEQISLADRAFSGPSPWVSELF